MGDHKEWLPVGSPTKHRDRAGTQSWGLFNQFIADAFNFVCEKDPRPRLELFSRYAQIGSVVIPFSSDTKNQILGTTAVPDLTGNLPFTSIKQEVGYAAVFLAALDRIVAAYDQGGAQWVVGRSAGGIDPRKLKQLPSGTLSFNEAVAVVYALMSRGAAGMREDLANKFLLLADLGGGFLDISVAHDLRYEEHSGNATIVNYGGYPLGVDRIDKRFSRDAIQNPYSLLDLIGYAIHYHYWDYMRRPGAKQNGAIVLSGGGFKRMNPDTVIERLTPLVQVAPGTRLYFEEVDTKYLTLAGLGRLAQLTTVKDTPNDEGGGGEDISRRNPTFHGGQQVLPKLLKDDASWYALMDRLRAEAY